MKVYVASSWRNSQQPQVVRALRNAGLTVYDFRSPCDGNRGFHWSKIDPNWQAWDPAEFSEALLHPLARDGFACDMAALKDADVVVLLMPCGRSAHLEAGWAAGAGKRTVIMLADGEPELNYAMTTAVLTDLDLLVDRLLMWQQEIEEAAGQSNA